MRWRSAPADRATRRQATRPGCGARSEAAGAACRALREAGVEERCHLARPRAAQWPACLELPEELGGAQDEVVASHEAAQQRELGAGEHERRTDRCIERIEELGAYGRDLVVEGVEQRGAVAAADPQHLVAREVAATHRHARARHVLGGDDPYARRRHDEVVDARQAGASDAAVQREAALLELVREAPGALAGDARGKRACGQRRTDAARPAVLAQRVAHERRILEIGKARIGEGVRSHAPKNGCIHAHLERVASADAPAREVGSVASVRIAVISDTHLPKGSRVLPAACVERCASADAILHGGDINDLATLRWLGTLGPPVHAVWGNNCTDEVRAVVPNELRVTLDGLEVGMVHIGGPAAGRPERLARRFPRCALVIFGHSHVPEHHVTADGVHVLNPGSPTERRRAPHCAMAIVTTAGGAVDGVEFVEL